ncbi:MAG: glycosyltransferase family 2 protein [Nitrospira sp.]|nr:glycosyltransferase family 2 protein [bacterium]MBL7049051.1 glycosyltransferase family 2 protein [Nitrospira sp.]
MAPLPLSVCIISFNESANIGRCLESVWEIASEIVVVDSHSTDDTVAIAESFGAVVYREKWMGHVAQKNSALKKCTQPWILSLDCDEEVSDELKNNLAEALKSEEHTGYSINRRTYCFGKWIRYSCYPDWNTRLSRKDTAIWEGHDPHDMLKVSGKTGRMRGDILHYSYKNLEDYYSKTVAYAVIGAESYIKTGRKGGLLKLIFNPIAGFLKHYFLKLGFLDGVQGLILATGNFYYTFLKYSIIWERKNKAAEK